MISASVYKSISAASSEEISEIITLIKARQHALQQEAALEIKLNLNLVNMVVLSLVK